MSSDRINSSVLDSVLNSRVFIQFIDKSSCTGRLLDYDSSMICVESSGEEVLYSIWAVKSIRKMK